MDIIPFIKKNGLWYLDKPEYLNSENTGFVAALIMVENGIVNLLNELSCSLFTTIHLEFNYKPIHPYDALLIKEGARYKCVSVMGKDWDILIWFPHYVFRAMVSNSNPDRIYIKNVVVSI